MRLQGADDLFRGESPALRRPSSLSRNRLTSEAGGFRGAGQRPKGRSGNWGIADNAIAALLFCLVKALIS